MKEFTKKEVVELFEEYLSQGKDGNTKTIVNEFLKEKGLLEIELERGVWYKCDDGEDRVAFVCYVPHSKWAGNYGYGFNYEGIWRDLGEYKILMHTPLKATKEELLPLFKAHAKQLGLVEGVEFEWNTIRYGKKICENKFYFRRGVLYNNGVTIFDNNKWATPIEKKLTLEERLTILEDKLKNK